MLLVQPFCSYLVSTQCQWRDEDYAAHYYAIMCKGDADKLASIKTTARNLPIGFGGTSTKVVKNSEGVARVRRHFGAWAGDMIRAAGFTHPTIIPIPNSHVTRDVAQFRTMEIAQAIAGGFGQEATARSSVRFQLAMAKSHLGGTRDVDTIARNMLVEPNFKADEIVLVDDILTSGAHLKAAKRVLQAAGMNVERAIVCARRTDHPEPNPFNLTAEDLEAQPDFDFNEFF